MTDPIQTVRERGGFVLEGATEAVFIITDTELSSLEAVVNAARAWSTAQDDQDPAIDALLEALSTLDPTEAPR